jgi:hypothetical protein
MQPEGLRVIYFEEVERRTFVVCPGGNQAAKTYHIHGGWEARAARLCPAKTS